MHLVTVTELSLKRIVTKTMKVPIFEEFFVELIIKMCRLLEILYPQVNT